MKKENNISSSNQEDKVTIRFTPDLNKKLHAHCEENNISVSAFIRDAVADALSEPEKKQSKKPYSIADLKKLIAIEEEEIERNKVFLDFTQKLNDLKEENNKIMKQAYENLERVQQK